MGKHNEILPSKYTHFVRKLASGKFYPKSVSHMTVLGLLNRAIDTLDNSLDRVKRDVFYGASKGFEFKVGYFDPEFTPRQWNIFHAIIGILTEAGELAIIAKDMAFGSGEVNEENLLEELGDLRFYMELAAMNIGASETEVRQANTAKLMERYKDGEFSEDAALNRDKNKEMEALNDVRQ